ncbi:MAG TPA: transglycosylase family protein [Streptosporangiaceae bacterium]
MAAAICLSPQALADTPAAQAVTHHAVAADAAYWRATPPAQLMATAWWAKQAEPAAAEPAAAEPSSPATYTVRANDSLSSIAGRVYHNPNAWPALYWANRGKIHWANVIETGQVLRVPVKPAKIPAPPGLLGPLAPPAPAAAAPAGPEAMPAAPAPAASTYSGGVPGGAFGQCVIARESGGQSQVMNATGHYGLYQFSAGTWAAYGGSPADFGHASAAEQNQVFDNALAAGGQSNWSAYDGC